MRATKFSEDVRPISDLKTQAAEIVQHVQRSRRPVLLTRRGRGVAVLLQLSDYEALVERVGFMDAVEAGARAAAAGDLHADEEAMKIVDSFGTRGGE